MDAKALARLLQSKPVVAGTPVDRCPACGDFSILYGPVEHYDRTIKVQALRCLHGDHWWTRRVK